MNFFILVDLEMFDLLLVKYDLALKTFDYMHVLLMLIAAKYFNS